MSNIDVNITLQQSKKVIRFNQIDGIGIIKEDGSMDFFDRVKESRISEMSREEISGLKEEIRVVVEEMAANGETITVLAVHEKTGIHKLFLEHCSVVREAEIRQFMKEQIERSNEREKSYFKRTSERKNIR
jgi:ribosomal protein S13